MSKINPYQRLLNEAGKWAYEIRYPKNIKMWVYPKSKLGLNWNLTDLYERTKAAEQLGYDVILVATDEGLEVKYQKMKPEIPHNWK